MALVKYEVQEKKPGKAFQFMHKGEPQKAGGVLTLDDSKSETQDLLHRKLIAEVPSKKVVKE